MKFPFLRTEVEFDGNTTAGPAFVSPPSYISSSSYTSPYGYARAIVIDHTQVGGSNLTNFPLVFRGIFPFLATVANGGDVRNANGYDIAFATDNAGASLLDWEIVSYDGNIGQVEYWIRIPTLSASADTTIYLLYGNAGITTNRSNSAGVWDSTFLGVWHMTALTDSTSHANNLTTANPFIPAQIFNPCTGIVGGAQSIPGPPDCYATAGASASLAGLSAAATTWTFWIYVNHSANSTVAHRGYNTSNHGWAINLVSGGEPQIVFPLSITNESYTAGGFVDDWTKIDITYTGTLGAGNVLIYVDGVSQGITRSAGSGVQASDAADDFQWGVNHSLGWDSSPNALIDECRVANVVRTAGWLTAEYNNQATGTFFTLAGVSNFLAPSAGVPEFFNSSAALTASNSTPPFFGVLGFNGKLYGLSYLTTTNRFGSTVTVPHIFRSTDGIAWTDIADLTGVAFFVAGWQLNGIVTYACTTDPDISRPNYGEIDFLVDFSLTTETFGSVYANPGSPPSIANQYSPCVLKLSVAGTAVIVGIQENAPAHVYGPFTPDFIVPPPQPNEMLWDFPEITDVLAGGVFEIVSGTGVGFTSVVLGNGVFEPGPKNYAILADNLPAVDGTTQFTITLTGPQKFAVTVLYWNGTYWYTTTLSSASTDIFQVIGAWVDSSDNVYAIWQEGTGVTATQVFGFQSFSTAHLTKGVPYTFPVDTDMSGFNRQLQCMWGETAFLHAGGIRGIDGGIGSATAIEHWTLALPYNLGTSPSWQVETVSTTGLYDTIFMYGSQDVDGSPVIGIVSDQYDSLGNLVGAQQSLLLAAKKVSGTWTGLIQMMNGKIFDPTSLINGLSFSVGPAPASPFVPPVLACPLGTAVAGVPYSQPLIVGGGVPPFTYAIIAGALPPGLSLNTATGVISGTPTGSGTYEYEPQVTDSTGAIAVASCAFVLGPPPGPAIPGIQTLRFEIPQRRWFQHTYAAPVSLHYLDEAEASKPNDQQLLMLATNANSILKSGGNDDAGTPIVTIVQGRSDDNGDQRTQKLYVDDITDADGTGALLTTLLFDDANTVGPTLTISPVSGRQQYIQNISSLIELNLYRNVAPRFYWTGGPAGPHIYAFEPAGFLQPYLSKFFVTQFLALGVTGWHHVRRTYPALISNSPVIFTIQTQDGRQYVITVPSTGGQFMVVPLMVPQACKDLAFGLQIDGQGQTFAFFPADWTVEVKLTWTQPTYTLLPLFKAPGYTG